jgi:hypothetical protein
MLSVIALCIGGLQLLAFGIWAIIDIQGMMGLVGITLSNPMAVIEARAFYGGAELAAGGLMMLGAIKPRWREFALVLMASMFFAIGLTRTVGMMGVADPGTFTWVALAVEALCVALAVLALKSRSS